MKNPMKLALKELPRLGCTVTYKDSRHIAFAMPDGSRWVCPQSVSLAKVREVVKRWTVRGDYFVGRPEVADPPSLAGYRLTRSRHFTERCAEMTVQGMEVAEVHSALTAPKRVLLGSAGRLLYCSDRVAVVIHLEDTAVAVTCLWTTNALWELNPRGEKEVAA